MIGPLPGFSTRIVWIAAALLGVRTLVRAGDGVRIRELVEDGRFARARELAAEELVALPPCAPARVELECLQAEAARRGNGKLAPGTLALARNSVALARELYGADDARTAEPLLQLGVLHCVRREWPEAREDLERALTLFRSAGSPRRAVALAYLAIEILSGEGDGLRALACLDEADQASADGTPDRAWVLDMRGNVLAALDRTEEALAAYAGSLEIRRRCQRGDHPLLANTLLNLGTMQDLAGRLAPARTTYEEVLAILESGAEISWTLADVRVKLGTICRGVGDRERATTCFETALVELEERGQQATTVYADVLYSLGQLALEGRDWASARSFGERSLTALGTVPDADPRLLGAAQVLVAWVEFHDVHPDFDRAQDLASKASVAGDPKAGWTLAWVAAARGDLAHAHDLLSQGLDTCPDSDRPNLLRDLSRVSLLRGDLAGAFEESLESEARAREQWERSALGLEEISAIGLEEVNSLLPALNPAVCAAARLARPEAAERTWNALLLSRDRVLREGTERLALARAGATPELSRAASRLAEARLRLAAAYVQSRRSGDSPELQTRIDEARAEREQAERDLESQPRGSEPPISLSGVRQALEPGVSLVRFCLADRPPREPRADAPPLFWEPCYYACVLGGRDGEARILELADFKLVHERIADLLEAIRTGAKVSAYSRIASELRRRLLDPVLAALPETSLVLLVPEGELSRIPFLALCWDDGKFLAETGPLLHVLGSEDDVLRAREPSRTGSGLLALGDPDFDARHDAVLADDAVLVGTSRSAPALVDFPALPQTRAEVEDLLACWRKSGHAEEKADLLLGADASEPEFRRLASGRRVIHLATHGFYEDAIAPGSRGESRGVPAVAAAPLTPVSQPDPSGSSVLPNLRSGLAFAGAGSQAGVRHGEDDGILTTEEVLGLDLTGVEWVVLSACDTGLGEIRRFEGVLGLRRAMRMAGARTVIASLWPVEDRWAREWMGALYRARLDDRLSTAEAVRAASLAVLEKLRREGDEPLPSRWASFVAVGDWR